MTLNFLSFSYANYYNSVIYSSNVNSLLSMFLKEFFDISLNFIALKNYFFKKLLKIFFNLTFNLSRYKRNIILLNVSA